MLLSCCTYILWVLQLKDLSHKLIRERTDKYKRSKQPSPNPAAAALSSSAAAGTTGQQIMSPKLLALINNLPVCPHSLLKYLISTTYQLPACVSLLPYTITFCMSLMALAHHPQNCKKCSYLQYLISHIYHMLKPTYVCFTTHRSKHGLPYLVFHVYLRCIHILIFYTLSTYYILLCIPLQARIYMTGKADLYMKDVISHMMSSHNPATWPHTINLLVSKYLLSIYASLIFSYASLIRCCVHMSYTWAAGDSKHVCFDNMLTNHKKGKHSFFVVFVSFCVMLIINPKQPMVLYSQIMYSVYNSVHKLHMSSLLLFLYPHTQIWSICQLSPCISIIKRIRLPNELSNKHYCFL